MSGDKKAASRARRVEMLAGASTGDMVIRTVGVNSVSRHDPDFERLWRDGHIKPRRDDATKFEMTPHGWQWFKAQSEKIANKDAERTSRERMQARLREMAYVNNQRQQRNSRSAALEARRNAEVRKGLAEALIRTCATSTPGEILDTGWLTQDDLAAHSLGKLYLQLYKAVTPEDARGYTHVRTGELGFNQLSFMAKAPIKALHKRYLKKDTGTEEIAELLAVERHDGGAIFLLLTDNRPLPPLTPEEESRRAWMHPVPPNYTTYNRIFMLASNSLMSFYLMIEFR